MSVHFPSMAAWTSADVCTGSVTPGARALMAYWLESYEALASSLGIYNCRSVRGGATKSIHGEGRAIDCGVPVTAAGHRVMYEWLGKVAPHAKRLGIQLVIFDRTIWSAKRRPAGERYNGVHPHRDHAHVELTWGAARKLNLATLRAVAGDLREREPKPSSARAREVLIDWMGLVDAERGGRMRRRVVQGLLAAAGFSPKSTFVDLGNGRVRPDGVWGSASDDACRAYQNAEGMKVDGVAGPKTLSKLLGETPDAVVSVDSRREGVDAGRVQMVLAARGFVPASSFTLRKNGSAEPDGVFGDASATGTRRFQRSRGIAVDEKFGQQTWRAVANDY